MAKGKSSKGKGKGLNIALWVAQVLLAALFAFAGGMKLAMPIDQMAANPGGEWMLRMPWLIRFIGVAEVAGSLGMILPALLRIKPMLTGWAGVGLATIMVLATAHHASRSEPFALTLGFGFLAVFVAWGRLKKAPIAAKK